jgi:hypothetical protein
MYLRVISLSVRSSLVVLENCITCNRKKKFIRFVRCQIGSTAMMEIPINVCGARKAFIIEAGQEDLVLGYRSFEEDSVLE